MKVYIAGAITNNPNYEQQFKEAEQKLIKQGHAVINPVKNLGFEYRDYIDMGLCELMKCNCIYLLPGYEKSPGALLEKHYAELVGMRIIEVNPCLDCGFYDSDMGCSCPSTDMWYACPLESPTPEDFEVNAHEK